MADFLTTAVLARNEGGRFLPSALEAWGAFSDQIILLDDHSTDNTADLARKAGAKVFDAPTGTAWGNESGHRQKLFDLACEHTPDGGWILWLDADMCVGRSPRELMKGNVSAFAFHLYDLWAERSGKLYYREDKFWQGHNHPRVWMIRKPSPQDWAWNERGIHCGHLPANFSFDRGVGIAPYDMALLHWAYVSSDLRHEKLQQYKLQDDKLYTYEQRHAASIADKDPRILPLPFVPHYKLVRVPPAYGEAA